MLIFTANVSKKIKSMSNPHFRLALDFIGDKCQFSAYRLGKNADELPYLRGDILPNCEIHVEICDTGDHSQDAAIVRVLEAVQQTLQPE